jgi:hypothetical protein
MLKKSFVFFVKCSFPKSTHLIQHLISADVNKINRGHRLELDAEDMGKTCSYSFDLNEPQLGAAQSNADLPREWYVNWYINFNSSVDEHDFELSWAFIPNKFVDLASGVIQLPRTHGFAVSDSSRRDANSIENLGELEFTFESTHINRNYRVFFEVNGDQPTAATEGIQNTEKFLNRKYLTYLNKRISKYELINTNIFNDSNQFKLDEIGANSIRVRRNEKYSIKLSYKLDQSLGDCDFDTGSMCGFVANSFPVESDSAFSLPHTDSLLITHAPKYPFLSTGDREVSRKASDFYLAVSRAAGKSDRQSILYTPLIQAQPNQSNLDSWNAYNQKIFSISFKYSIGSMADSIELILLQNRSDVKYVTRNFATHPIHMFSSNSANGEGNKHVFRIPGPVEKSCEGVRNQEQFAEWSSKRQGDASSEDEENWFEVRKMSFFSCFDFRVGFSFERAANQDTTSNDASVITTTSRGQFGLDDVQLNVEETLLGLCKENVCMNNGRCFQFNGEDICCCPPGFEVG